MDLCHISPDRQSHLLAPGQADPGGMARAVHRMLLVAAASMSHPTWPGAAVDGDSVDVKLMPSSVFYLLANHPLTLPAVGQRGGDQVRHGINPHWPLYRPLPALQSPVRSVCSERVVSSGVWD